LRHGTTSLVAALEVRTGAVLAECQPRHRAREFRQFLDRMDGAVPPDLDIHLILDNYGTHQTQLIRRWLAKRAPLPPPFHPNRGQLAQPR
jgi:transposase